MYRTAAKAPEREPTVVRYHLPGPFLGVFLALVLAMFGAGFTIPVLGSIRDVSVTCTRDPGPGQCTIAKKYSFLGTDREVVPLGAILGVAVRPHSGKNRTTYSVALLLAGAEKELPAGGTAESRQAFAAHLRDFLASDGRRTFAEIYDVGSPAWFAFFLVWPLLGYFAWFLVLPVDVVFDWRADRVRVVRSRWPLSPSVESFSFDELEGPLVVAKSNGKGTSYSVVLRRRHGEDVVLKRGSGGSAGYQRRIAGELEALFDARRKEKRDEDALRS